MSGILSLIWEFLFQIIIVVNICFALIVVFLERKNPSATVAWLMALIFLPVVGFVLYLFVGQSFYRERMFKVKKEQDQKFIAFIESQKKDLFTDERPISGTLSDSYKRMALMLMENNLSALTINNDVKVYVDGNEKFAALIEAIKGAKDHIHMEYYILKDDEIGREVFAALTERAKAGVEVRFLGDGLGCAGPKKAFYKPFLDAGGKLAFFFPSLISIRHPRLNYRNHRKIAVIDGKTGFIGGFNIGDDYLSRIPEWAPWRDTAVRIIGDSVILMQIRFFLDWNYANSENSGEQVEFLERYFPKLEESDGKEGTGIRSLPVQIVSGGPDTYWNPVKESYLKMITLAKESVYIQTPYFIPDMSIIDALRMAALSGIDVKIMIPSKPDHMFVYWAGYSFIEQLFDAGVKAYTYTDGFIHAKTIVVDGEVASVGSANWDVRSFRLNFETNAVMYDSGVAEELKSYFIRDLDDCEELTPERIRNLPAIIRVKLSISRLFSPLL
ncbi:cardiolipin synthase [Methanoplanus sp. FWC-SCC4]|uniref:Cardiolipin synthase n=1 Tax=Methanochimaera problematica TaxID=2609417 RepID=A0AA97I3E2_9EURY|nr:cardiolipin synthase [Methanoplanus sp. FWC-SCC4]WOF17265.1 cardiolipin synthase [Methanoplanus sp. FWC-SCC4]